jgi:hypothetical protein
MRRRPEEFEPLSEVVERLELAGFSTEGAHRAIRDILRDRRYQKIVSWADTATGAITYQMVSLVGAPSVDEINWKTSSFNNQLLDSRERRLDKIGVRIADLRWYLKGGELSPDPVGPVRASPSTLELKDVHETSAQTVAGERAAIKALATHLGSHPDITRADAKRWLLKQEFAVNPRGFQFRVWPEARRLAGLPPIAPPGPRRNRHVARNDCRSFQRRKLLSI